MEAARQFAPLDPSKNKDYGPPYKNEYNWDPENRGPKKCFYETGDEADRCYVTTNGGPGGQKKPKTGPASNRTEYNKKYRKQRLKKKGEADMTTAFDDLVKLAYDNPGPVRNALLPILAKEAKGKIPPQFLENIKKKQDEAKDKGGDKDDKDDKDDDKDSGKPWEKKKKASRSKRALIELPGIDRRKIAELRKIVDPITYKLLRQVYSTLVEKFDQNDEQAMNRIIGSINAGSKWDAALHQNNIFKAANLLKIQLPHHMF